MAIKIETDTLQEAVELMASQVRQGDRPKDGTWSLTFGSSEKQRGTVKVPHKLAREVVKQSECPDEMVRHVAVFGGL